MAALSNTTVNHGNKTVLNTAQLAPVVDNIPGAETPYSPHDLLVFNNRLQSTLVLDELLEIFVDLVKEHVSIDSLKYHFSPQVSEIKIGRDFPHTCRYRLAVNELAIGEVIFTRRRPFNSAETDKLESILSNLVYPLRNALLYQQALTRAHKDPLTGVHNRAAMDDTLRSELNRAKRYRNPMSLMILDIDHFKKINDTYGHATGDCLLKLLADTTASCMRRSDMLFRYGGEEFVILLNNTDIAGANRLAERIRRKVERLEKPCDKDIQVTVSLGVACVRENDSETSLFERADKALYEAKANGRNCVVVTK